MQQTRFGERLAYSFGDLASNLAIATVNFFIVFYYTNTMHVNAGIVGTILMISLFADSVFDVVMGVAVDKTHSRFGKARPWILRMCLPFAVIFVLMFSVPEIGATGKVIYVAVTYLAFNLLYSAANIPYGILNSLIAQDQYERSVINIFRMFMAYGTNILVCSVTLAIVTHLGGNAAAWRSTAILYAAAALCLFLITFAFTKERPVISHNAERPSVPLSTGLRALLRNKYWKLLALFAVVLYINNSTNNSVTVYYAQNFLHNGNLVGPITMSFFIPIVIGLFFLAPFIRRFGKRNLTMAGIVLAIFGSLLMLCGPESLAVILAGNILKGISMIPVFGTFFAMVPDTIEYGEWKTGVRTEGLVYSASSFGIKMGNGLGAALLGWTLALSGYSGGAKQPPTAMAAIKDVYILLPVVLYFVLIGIMWFYKLDREYPEIIAELDRRHEAADKQKP